MAEPADALIQQSIETLQTPVPDNVKYRGVSMAPALAANKEVNKASEEESSVIKDATALTKTATADYKQGQLESAAATAAGAMADAARAAEIASKYDVYNSLAETQKRMADAIAQAGIVLTTKKADADAELQNIKEMQSVGMLDNPLEWAYNQLQLPSRIRSYNASADEINSAQNTINQGLNTVAAISAGGVNNVPAITAAQAKATADKALANAHILNANADENLAAKSVDFAAKNMAAKVAAAGVTDNTTRLQQTEAEHAFQSQIANIQLADTKAKRLIEAAKYMELLTDKRQVQENLHTYELIMGLPKDSVPIAAFNRYPKDKQEEIMAISASGRYGAGPEDAITNMRTLGIGNNIPDSTKKVASFIVEQEKKVIESIDKDINALITEGKLPASEKIKVRNIKLNEKITEAINAEISSPNSKLLGLATPAEVLSSTLVAPDSPLGKILTPISQTNAPVNIETVSAAISAALPNDINAQGVLLSEYVKKAKLISVNASNLKAFGTNIKIPNGTIVDLGMSFNQENLSVQDILESPLKAAFSRFNRKTPVNIETPEGATKYQLFKAVRAKQEAAGEPTNITLDQGSLFGY